MKKISSFLVLSLIILAVCSFSPKSVLADGIEVYIPFEELVDLEAEKQRNK